MQIYHVCKPDILTALVEDEETMILFCGVDLLEGSSPPPGRNSLLGTLYITSSDADNYSGNLVTKVTCELLELKACFPNVCTGYNAMKKWSDRIKKSCVY